MLYVLNVYVLYVSYQHFTVIILYFRLHELILLSVGGGGNGSGEMTAKRDTAVGDGRSLPMSTDKTFDHLDIFQPSLWQQN